MKKHRTASFGIGALLYACRLPLILGISFFLILACLLSSLPLSLLGVGGSVLDSGELRRTWSGLCSQAEAVIDSTYQRQLSLANESVSSAMDELKVRFGPSCEYSVSREITLDGDPAPGSAVVSRLTLNGFLAVYGTVSRYCDGTGVYADLVSVCWSDPADQEKEAYDSFLKNVRLHASGMFSADAPAVRVTASTDPETGVKTVRGTICADIRSSSGSFMEREVENAHRILKESGEPDPEGRLQREIAEMLDALNGQTGTTGSVTVSRADLYAKTLLSPLYPIYSCRACSLRFPFPDSDITAFFGPRTLRGKPNFHTGIDFGEARDTPILCPCDGFVVFAYDGCLKDNDPEAGYGNYVIIYHGRSGGRDLYTLYAHLQRVDVRAGQELRQGDCLGAVGSRGNSTGPHLHWEVNTYDLDTSAAEAVDPKGYV